MDWIFSTLESPGFFPRRIAIGVDFFHWNREDSFHGNADSFHGNALPQQSCTLPQHTVLHCAAEPDAEPGVAAELPSTLADVNMPGASKDSEDK